MSQSAKSSPATQRDAASLYLEALTHVEKLVQAQPAEKSRSAWRRWARELIDYEAKTLTPREKRAPRLTRYSDGAGERFLAVMKVIQATETRLKDGKGGPSSSGESEPEEPSLSRRSSRRMAGNVRAVEAQKTRQSDDSSKTAVSAPNLTDAQRTINYDIPCGRCALAGIACAGKEGRACFTCRAHHHHCDLSSRHPCERERTDKSGREAEEQGSVSTAAATRSAKRDGKGTKNSKKDAEKNSGEGESAAETREARPRRAATLVNNWRIGSPKTISQLRAGSSSSSSLLRKRRATDADLSITGSAPPGPSPSKRAKAVPTRRGEEQHADEPDFDREDVRDALLVCEAAFRQLRKALRI